MAPAMAAVVADDVDVRLLRRVALVEGPTGVGDPDRGGVAAVLDVETTGLDCTVDTVIELGVRRLRFDRDGRIVRIGRPYHWLHDPGVPLSPEVSRLTGLSDADLGGSAMDPEAVRGILAGVDLVLGHNSAFDRPFVERAVAGLDHLVWGCSMAQVDWPGLGYDGRKLGYLLNQCGLYHQPHGAVADVDAVVALLAEEVDGRTMLSRLLDEAWLDGWTVHAEGAGFSAKDDLKRRGYRWNPDRRVWWREVAEGARDDERAWLEANVYGDRARVMGMAPSWELLDHRRRFAERAR